MKAVSVNLSREKGTIKVAQAQITVDELGIVGDAHAGHWHRQVSLLASESIATFANQTGRTIEAGEFAENITTQGLDLRKLGYLDRLTIGSVELEITQFGKACHGDQCAIFRETGQCIMPSQGIFCRVIQGGTIGIDTAINHFSRSLRCHVITMSDRASQGVYQDQSGPRVQELLTDFFHHKYWHPEFTRIVLPDEESVLRQNLEECLQSKVDIIIITGGTGIGPHDVTPDVVHEFCAKTIPGIMECIRLKYGSTAPRALLSRSVAGVRGKTLVYAIPGSVKAVTEYMAEIVKTLEHSMFMLHGLDVH